MAGKVAKNNSNVSFNVEPYWAEDAVYLTSASVEISLDHLRSLFQEASHGGATHQVDEDPRTVSITLKPTFSGETSGADCFIRFLTSSRVKKTTWGCSVTRSSSLFILSPYAA